MAISETSLRDVLLFKFDEINASGGVMGKMIEPVVVDGASDWPLFAEKGIAFNGSGGRVKSQENHHLTKNVFIGETKANGQFKILKEYKDVVGEPFLKGTYK